MRENKKNFNGFLYYDRKEINIKERIIVFLLKLNGLKNNERFNLCYTCSTKKSLILFGWGFSLSKPQAWYIIDARSAAYIIKGGKPPLYFITRQRAFSCDLMICTTLCRWYTKLCFDDIHGTAVIEQIGSNILKQAPPKISLSISA